jgi:hypothetical protein
MKRRFAVGVGLAIAATIAVGAGSRMGQKQDGIKVGERLPVRAANGSTAPTEDQAGGRL